MSEQYFVQMDGTTVGPLSSRQLRDMATQGRITTDTQISKTSRGPWIPANKVKGLFTSAPPAPPELLPVPDSAVSRTAAAVPVSAAQAVTSQETLLWSGRRSQIVNLRSFVLCGLFCWLVVPIFVAVWRWLTVRCSSFELTSQRLRITTGVLSRRTDELELYRVKDTAYEQPFYLRLFSLANIIITTSDVSTPLVVIEAIPAEEARQLRETTRICVEQLRDRKRVREVDVI